uniref:Uncharacterized protein n=1 Tax=Arundo donax TaxID=35708 RepID=A0A0A8XYA6_ARUDO
MFDFRQLANYICYVALVAMYTRSNAPLCCIHFESK